MPARKASVLAITRFMTVTLSRCPSPPSRATVKKPRAVQDVVLSGCSRSWEWTFSHDHELCQPFFFTFMRMVVRSGRKHRSGKDET